MKIRKSVRAIGASLPIAALLLQSVPSLASPVTDLEGARAAGALEDMDRRGYVQTSAYKADGGSYTYWWNRDTKSCVRLLTRDGKIAATKTSTAQDCGQKSSGGSNDAAAAAIAGAAIIAGVAALSHKSHHRDDQEYNDSQSYAEFERGHRDGLMAHSFADYNNSKQYRDGYQSGVNERGYQSGYRSDNRSYQTSSYRSVTPVYVDDLQGARASGALSDLEGRGFRSVDSFQSGSNGAGTVWWNGRTRQCVQVITVDGHIDSVSDIGTHPRCR
jgi:hypothetical protein